jgi:cell division GTPase FtsZ
VSAVKPQQRPAFGLPGRIQAPNSKPRSIAVVGIGEGGADVARARARDPEPNVEVHVLAKSAAGGDPVNAIKALGGDLQRDLMDADMMFLVARKGDDVSLAPVVARIAHSKNHPVTALYIVPADAPGSADEDETLKTLRTAVEMLVVVSDESYVPAMLSQLSIGNPT